MLTKERLGSGEHLPHDEAEAVNIPLLVVLLVVRNLAVMKVRRRNRRGGGGGIRRFSMRACKRYKKRGLFYRFNYTTTTGAKTKTKARKTQLSP